MEAELGPTSDNQTAYRLLQWVFEDDDTARETFEQGRNTDYAYLGSVDVFSSLDTAKAEYPGQTWHPYRSGYRAFDPDDAGMLCEIQPRTVLVFAA